MKIISADPDSKNKIVATEEIIQYTLTLVMRNAKLSNDAISPRRSPKEEMFPNLKFNERESVTR